MPPSDHDRRRFLAAAAMTIAGAHLGTVSTGNASDSAPRELAAIGSAVDWLNSPRLTPSSLAGESCSSASGPPPVSTGCVRSHIFAPGRRSTGKGSS
jgi:hypothetical protein